jgi:hypothetical protein
MDIANIGARCCAWMPTGSFRTSISCASAVVIELRIDDREQQLRVRNHAADILRDGQPRHGRFDSKRIQSHRGDHAVATYAKSLPTRKSAPFRCRL